MLVASRFTSHSHGAGRVSSKSLTSKTRRRSGEAQIPKFDRCASPQAWTVIPVTGAGARPVAMISAPPRKNANGEASIRPYRIGSRSAIRSAPPGQTSSGARATPSRHRVPGKAA
jgi:hypothetical protein